MPDEIRGLEMTSPGSAPGRGFTVLAAGGVVLAVSAMLFAVGMARTDARETARECAAALHAATTATENVAAALAAAEASLDLATAGTTHPDGARLTAAVDDARGALVSVEIPTDCARRDDAERIAALADESADRAAALAAIVTALTDDAAVSSPAGDTVRTRQPRHQPLKPQLVAETVVASRGLGHQLWSHGGGAPITRPGESVDRG